MDYILWCVSSDVKSEIRFVHFNYKSETEKPILDVKAYKRISDLT